MNKDIKKLLDDTTKNLQSSIDDAIENKEKTIHFPVKKEFLNALMDVNDGLQENNETIPDAERQKCKNVVGNVLEFVAEAVGGSSAKNAVKDISKVVDGVSGVAAEGIVNVIDGVSNWWNKPVRNTADGKPQTRGQKWSRRLSKGCDATIDCLSEGVEIIGNAFADNKIEDIYLEIPLLLGKQFVKALEWLNEWIDGWDFSPKDKSNEKPSGKDVTKGDETKNLPGPSKRLEKGETENIPAPQVKILRNNKGSERETRNLPRIKAMVENSR